MTAVCVTIMRPTVTLAVRRTVAYNTVDNWVCDDSSGWALQTQSRVEYSTGTEEVGYTSTDMSLAHVPV